MGFAAFHLLEYGKENLKCRFKDVLTMFAYLIRETRTMEKRVVLSQTLQKCTSDYSCCREVRSKVTSTVRKDIYVCCVV
jgi:hypothetical protein